MTTFRAALLLAALAAPAAAEPLRVYIAPDDHTDYVWSGTEEQYRSYFPRALDAYLDQADATAGAPADQRARWNTDGTIWISTYEAERSPAQFARLIERVRDGTVSVPLNTLVSTQGGTPFEAIIRDMYYAGTLERRFGLDLDVAVAMENQVASYGLGAIYAGAGARYSWKGVCACATLVPDSGDRPAEAYWWTGPDGSRLLTKWMSLHPALPGTVDRNQGPGGYAEARVPREAVEFVSTDAGFRAKWPFAAVGLFGAGWDDLEYIVPLGDPRSFPGVAADLTTPDRRVIVSNQLDFFRDFEGAYGAGLPAQAVSFGNEWELCTARFAAKTARVKRAMEKLRAAEAMATAVALSRPSFWSDRAAARAAAHRSLALFHEHNVCGGGAAGDGRAAFQERQAAAVEGYVDALHRDAAAALGALIPRATGKTRVWAFNPLGFTRTDVAEAAAPGTGAIHLWDVAANRQVAAETVGTGAGRVVRWAAASVPSLGYKVYEVRSGAGPTAFPAVATYAGGVLTSARWRVRLEADGRIASLVDRTNGERELAGSGGLNAFGSGAGTTTLERIGPVSATVRADIGGALPRTVRVTLYGAKARLDVENVIAGNFGDTRGYRFDFALADPYTRHEEVGAVIAARLETAGGRYSARERNSRYDWLTLGHFADMRAGAGGYGVTLANLDASFFKLGGSTRGALDTATPAIEVLAGGDAVGGGISQIADQAGDARFENRLALLPTASWSQDLSMRRSLEFTSPLATGAVAGSGTALPSRSWSMLSLSDPALLVWAVKPAEEGIAAGIIVRLWNQSGGAASFASTLGTGLRRTGPTARATHVETDWADQTGRAEVRGQQIATFRVRAAR